MRSAAFLGLVLLVGACASVSPVPIKSGDTCYRCNQTIVDVKLAAEAIGVNGMVRKFRSVRCLAQHTAEHQTALAGVFVTDYATGRFVRPDTALFVLAAVATDSQRAEYVAFGDVRQAVAFGDKNSTKPVDWSKVVQLIRAETATN